jgi:hypothetical protein
MYFGMGTARDTSNGQSFDFFGTGIPKSTPSLDGLFGTFGGDFMLRHNLGIGAEYSWRFSQHPYADLSYRPAFWDFNAVFQPTFAQKRIVPEFQGGLGGANLKFYVPQQSCLVSCQTFNTLIQSSNHFQVHGLAAVRFYVHGNVFVRPQVDLRWVHNFVEFGRDFVPQYGVSVGYTFGER